MTRDELSDRLRSLLPGGPDLRLLAPPPGTPASTVMGRWRLGEGALEVEVDTETGFFHACGPVGSAATEVMAHLLPSGVELPPLPLGYLDITGEMSSGTFTACVELLDTIELGGVYVSECRIEAGREPGSVWGRIDGVLDVADHRIETSIELSETLELAFRVRDVRFERLLADLDAGSGWTAALTGLRLADVEVSLSSGSDAHLRIAAEAVEVGARIELTARRESGRVVGTAAIHPGSTFSFGRLLGEEFEGLDDLFPSRTDVRLSIASSGEMSVSGPISLRGTGVDALFGVEDIAVGGVLSGTAGLVLTAALPVHTTDALVSIQGMSIFVRVAVPPAIGVVGTFLVALEDPPVEFALDTTVTPSSVALTARRDRWDAPFGIRGLCLEDLWLTVGGAVSGAPTVGIAGHAALRWRDAEGDREIRGGAAISVDPANPANNMIAFDFAELRVSELIDCVFEGELSAVDAARVTLWDVAIQVVPPMMAFGGYEAGIGLSGRVAIDHGRASVFGQFTGRLDLAGGLFIEGRVSPLRVDPFFALTGEHDAVGPRFRLAVTPLNPAILLSGQLRLFGTPVEAVEMRLTRDGLRTSIDRRLGAAAYGFDVVIEAIEDPALFQLTLAGTVELELSRRAGVKLAAELVVRAGRSDRVRIRNAGFSWNGTRYAVPDLRLVVRLDSLGDLTTIIERHVLEHFADVLKNL